MEPQSTWKFKRQVEKRPERDQEVHGVREINGKVSKNTWSNSNKVRTEKSLMGLNMKVMGASPMHWWKWEFEGKGLRAMEGEEIEILLWDKEGRGKKWKVVERSLLSSLSDQYTVQQSFLLGNFYVQLTTFLIF